MSSAQGQSVRDYRAEGQTLRLIFLWKGSLYKTIIKQILIWLILYYVLNLVYRFALNADQKFFFQQVVTDMDMGISFIPLSFVLGFYVNIIVNRYWNMWNNLPRPETLALRIASCIHGNEQRDQEIRRTAMRQIILAQVLTYRRISKPVQEKYPTMDSLVGIGLMNEEERELLEATSSDFPPYWTPLFWVASLFETARHEGRVKDDVALGHLSSDLAAFRAACGKTLQVEQIGIPLAYSQVVIIACYTFWCGSLVARQWVDDPDVAKENYFPVFSMLQLIIFFGWLCVAESMIHPFGNDADDFHLVSIVDNHINATYKMVDMCDKRKPSVTADPKWDRLRDMTSPGGSVPPPRIGPSNSKIAHARSFTQQKPEFNPQFYENKDPDPKDDGLVTRGRPAGGQAW